MNTPDSTRVEVNEALLADLEIKARATPVPWPAAWDWGCLTSRREGNFIAAASPCVVLALVERIRELESLLDAMSDRVRDEMRDRIDAEEEARFRD